MLKSNELRLGSIIDFDGMKSVVKEIDNQGVVVFIKETDETEWIDLFQFTPITLTEEILLKCGFVKEDLKPSNKHSNYFSIWINDYKYSFSFAYFREDWGFYHSYTDALREEDNNKFDAISFGIKYLHQLQNLYYCLCGKELEINL